MNELRECPFCGGRAEYSAHGLGQYSILCMTCSARSGRYNGMDTARDAWNRRTQPDNPPLSLQQLREMDGEPVWVEHFASPCSIKEPGEWLILKTCNPTREHPYVDFKDGALCAVYYGQGWLAYAHRKDGDR